MTREYSSLGLALLAPSARVAELPLPRVTLDDPAFAVMTDLSAQPAATTFPDERADRAHALMIERGVRLLFAFEHTQLAVEALLPKVVELVREILQRVSAHTPNRTAHHCRSAQSRTHPARAAMSPEGMLLRQVTPLRAR